MGEGEASINLIHGDSFKVLTGFEDNSVDVTFTSPPYNRRRNDKYIDYDDNIEHYDRFLILAIEAALRVSRRLVIINVQKTYYNKADVFRVIGYFNNQLTEIVVWEKRNPLPACGYSVTNAYELFLVFSKEPLKANSTYTKNIISTSVNSQMPSFHKAVMKQEVSDWFIENFTKTDEVVLDSFLGYGTTVISCLKYGRSCIGIEISEFYFTKSVERISELMEEYVGNSTEGTLLEFMEGAG